MPEGPRGQSDARTLSDYARASWRWKWLIVGVAIACALAAYYYSWRQAPQYQASTVLTYVEPVDPASPLSNPYIDPSVVEIALDNVSNVVASPTVVSHAEATLGGPPANAYVVSSELNVGTNSAGNSSSVTISAVSTSATESAAVANAYARAVIDWSRDQQLARVRQAEAATSDSLRRFQSADSKHSADYFVLAQRLQDLRVLASTATGEFQVVVPATVPAEPFAPRPKRSAIVGFGGGLFAAVALVLTFAVFSPRVRGRHDVAEALGLPVVGIIPEASGESLKRGKLITLTDPDAAASEALRLLRSNIEYFNVEEVSSLLVTSCVAGEGKSTMVCNLAVTLAMAGKRIAVVDGDLRESHVHEYFGIANDVGLTNVVAGEAKLADAIQSIDIPLPHRDSGGSDGRQPDSNLAAPRQRRLAVLTSGPRASDPGELVASKRFGAVVADLCNSNVDFVIVDSPALLEVGDAAAMAAEVEGLLMVVDADRVGRPTLHEARDLLAPLPCHKLGAVLVRARHGRTGHGYYGYRD
jgi:Mrp family chromosome partitioning ATPase/capsular polysaccharide biosynthesis protein